MAAAASLREQNSRCGGHNGLNFGLRAPVDVTTFIRLRGVVHSTPNLQHFHSRLWSIDHAELFCLDILGSDSATDFLELLKHLISLLF